MDEELDKNAELVQFADGNDELKPLKDVPADGEDLIDAFEGLALSKPILQ